MRGIGWLLAAGLVALPAVVGAQVMTITLGSERMSLDPGDFAGVAVSGNTVTLTLGQTATRQLARLTERPRGRAFVIAVCGTEILHAPLSTQIATPDFALPVDDAPQIGAWLDGSEACPN